MSNMIFILFLIKKCLNLMQKKIDAKLTGISYFIKVIAFNMHG